MTIQQAKEEIKRTAKIYLQRGKDGEYIMPYIRQRPILLIGPPGIGKTAIAEQISQELGISIVSYSITHHTRQSAIGLPKIAQKSYSGKSYDVTMYTMSEIIESVYAKIEENGIKEGILFIDEINCASETLAPAMLQFLQCKTFGNHKVPQGWIIVGAGNPPDYNKSVRRFDVVTLDRVRKITVDADCNSWLLYAGKRNIHPSVTAYIEYNRDAFYKLPFFDDTGEKSFITARGWEDLSEMIKGYERYVHSLNISPDRYSQQLIDYITEALVYEFIQDRETASDFAAFFEIYTRYNWELDINEVLKGNISESTVEKLKNNQSDRYMVISQLYELLKSRSEALIGEYDFINGVFPVLKRIKANAGKEDDIRKMIREENNLALSEFERCSDIAQVERLFSKKVEKLKADGMYYGECLDKAADFMGKILKKGSGEILVFSRRFTSDESCFRCAGLFPSKKFNRLVDVNSSDKVLEELLNDIRELYI